ncbi:hypothetical protein [Sphingomonas abietis]|uniref:Lipoprotein n=1 Tax=Sphingomonas abietis TaxID=3012344 RepID=A0ABY7NRF1_9SPHN|nr:hypothetical protein [Sphingomonas abietis]WBO22071.1 hypothetical protein PBT88_18230 [Sphingomonas abietis]
MRRLFIFPLLALSACSTSAASNDQSPIAAIEVPTPSRDDQSDLIEILKRVAPKQGFHVDDVSQQWREFARQAEDHPSPARKTLYAGVWSGKNDDDFIAAADDGGHKGRSWIICYSGHHPAAAKRFWLELKAAVYHRWPTAQPIPILPSGAVPLSTDLQLTSSGYQIIRTAAARYGLPASSPLIADGS